MCRRGQVGLGSASDFTSPDCTTNITVSVHAGYGLDSATVSLSGTGALDTGDHTVTLDSGGDGSTTIAAGGDGNVDGDIIITASGGGNTATTEVTWSAGTGCPPGP